MKKLWCLFLTTVLLAGFSACSDDDDAEDSYPSIVTEFANVLTDEEGTMTSFTTDDDVTYRISNSLTGYAKQTRYRVVCGYVADGQNATIYQMQGAYVLRDSSDHAVQEDPTSVLSVWRSGHYINMQLAPLTQGGTQYWGYLQDSIRGRKTYLSLHHNQNADPTSYTQTVYASLCVDSLKQTLEGDTIIFTINTFKGAKAWNFRK